MTGENGTGKGIVARAIHAASQRAEKAFVTVNMGGLNENLFESELFGHMKGALPTLKPSEPAASKLQTEGPYFWMRSGISHSRSRPSCFAPSKPASSSDLVLRKPGMRVSGFCRLRTQIYQLR